jgi:thiamine-monophosphate kinase
MAARPLGVLIAVALPARWLADLDALADGIGEAASSHACPVVGGDLSRSEHLSIAFTVLGSAASPLRRSTVLPGDVIYVTGSLGGPARALEALLRGDEPHPEDRARFARPSARVREARWLAAHGAHAMIDVSDGVSSELNHLSAASGVGIRLDTERIPFVDGSDAMRAARSAEEYELIVSAPHALDVDGFEREFGLRLTEIGRAHAAERPGVLAYRNDVLVDLGLGHDHFTT